MKTNQQKQFYLEWAHLTDLAYEMMRSRFLQTHDLKHALTEIRKVLRHHRESHWQELSHMLAKIK